MLFTASRRDKAKRLLSVAASVVASDITFTEACRRRALCMVGMQQRTSPGRQETFSLFRYLFRQRANRQQSLPVLTERLCYIAVKASRTMASIL